MYDIFYVSKNSGDDLDWKKIKSRYSHAHRLQNVKTFNDIKSKSFTKMFWVIWDDVTLTQNFDLTTYQATKWDDEYIHVFLNDQNKDGICLFPKNSAVSQKEFDNRFFINKKEIDIVASLPKQYKQYSPSSYDEYLAIEDDMFWIVWPNLHITNQEIFQIYFSYHNTYDRSENHIFKNISNGIESFINGLILCSAKKPLSKREFTIRYVIDKKEHDMVVSKSRYPIITATSFDQYNAALQTVKDDMFWLVWPNIEIIDETVLDLYFDPRDGKYDHDRSENHIFKNRCFDQESYVNGIMLCSVKKSISKREFDIRYVIDKKEHDVVLSKSKYPVINIESYDQYLREIENKKDDMFWLVWPNIKITDQSVFDLYFDPKDGKYDHDRSENHIFKNLCYNKESYVNGIMLCSVKKSISKREFDIRYVIDKKEHDRVVSKSVYPQFKINSYQDYLSALEQTKDDMFWASYPEIEITDQSVFDLYFDPRDGKNDYDRGVNHVFLHQFKEKEYTYNGLMLMSKQSKVGKREIDFRYLINKKEQEIIASQHRLYDIIFISYNEPNADENWDKLKSKFPRAKRVHGVKGIHKAHIKAAEICDTEMLWVVDGDAEIVENFKFDHVVTRYERNIVHVWRSQNPINGLVYGYGGVKLLPRQLTLAMDVNSTDMTTSISDQFRAVETVSNVTVFNTDPFNTWKSAFRECAKLSAKLISRQNDDETNERLEVWCTQGKDKKYGEYAIAGAQSGKEFGLSVKDDKAQIAKINDFDWLKQKFDGI